MAIGVADVLSDHIDRGILSVPLGTKATLQFEKLPRFEICEGASSNLPDELAQQNAQKIKSLVEHVKSNDILMILVSGGGSALLPLPVEGITLEEKLRTVKQVAHAGGSIKQLNTVRKNISQVKGGKLLEKCLSKNILTFIISDIVGDAIDLIASGPTVTDSSTVADCLHIFSELNVTSKLPTSVVKYLENNLSHSKHNHGIQHCSNLIIGSNEILTRNASKIASELGYKPFVLTNTLEGEAQTVGETFADICTSLLQNNKLKGNSSNLFQSLGSNVEVDFTEWKICLIASGETTVHVKGTGKGGRNQEMVLSFLSKLVHYQQNNGKVLDFTKMCFMSAGTDGQDGPTDATGAFCNGELLKLVASSDVDLGDYLTNNGSYDFFSKYFGGKFLLKTGLTGTNVMDMQILVLDFDV